MSILYQNALTKSVFCFKHGLEPPLCWKGNLMEDQEIYWWKHAEKYCTKEEILWKTHRNIGWNTQRNIGRRPNTEAAAQKQKLEQFLSFFWAQSWKKPRQKNCKTKARKFKSGEQTVWDLFSCPGQLNKWPCHWPTDYNDYNDCNEKKFTPKKMGAEVLILPNS